ncbi:MAG: lipoyl(octanoyl) transferase LipB [Candidatus Dormibacteraeota bacterium]|uniref:Octanoyltransferase n=1 Tax=Candidatus Dormiibacter inghamiae TaxID=3127013 RepID=A0A934KEX3_9BACT|nr:lipoyl(octanoyl) transferase LipB [Candidatus Dormibacteraeota bacterium]MBJ7605336.1 lipoyl(octanoyl) transferase LipB [Candidatus Dormibacteraeota bacterium]
MSRSQPVVRACWLGSVPYRDGWSLQRVLVEAVKAGRELDTLLLLEHPAVFTIGRRGDGSTLLWTADECARRGVEVVWSDRGGDATYHGPGQLVGYPILNLPRLGSDILRHIRGLERSLIAYLASLGIASEPGGKGLTGVWSRGAAPPSPAKVAAIGVKLNQRVISHGFALNLTSDLDTFNSGIVPCGLSGKRATSVLELGGPRLSVQEAACGYAPFFAAEFGVSLHWSAVDALPEPVAGQLPSPSEPLAVPTDL